jgi:phosphonatase-like hydrolase
MSVAQLVVLDLAGTTFDDGGLVVAALQSALARVGIETPAAEIAPYRGANKIQVFRHFAARAFGPGTEAVRAAREGLEAFGEELTVQFRARPLDPFPGLVEALTVMREAGVKLATNTGFTRALAELVLQRLGRVSELFDAHVCGDDVPVGRPAPYMLYLAMERAGVQDVRGLVAVGDTALDLKAGTNAGAGGVVGVLTGGADIADLGRARHTHLLPSAAELPALLRDEFGISAIPAAPATGFDSP